MQTTLSIISPIYNEAGNVLRLHSAVAAAMQAAGYAYELILVNDGSTDASAQEMDAAHAADPQRVRLIHLKRNYGQTAAMMAGMDAAKHPIIVPLDADLQNNPADIPRLIAKLDEGYDVVSGWRRKRKDAALRRNLPSRIANALIGWVSGVRIHDYGCTLKAYRAHVLEDVDLYGEMHRFIPIYASWNGARITEIEVGHAPRTVGESKYGLERVLKVILDIMVVYFLRHFAHKPMHLFGMAGLFSFTVSGASGFAALILKFAFENKDLVQTPLPLLSAMSLLIGVLCMLLGLLAELVMRTYYGSQNKRVYKIKTQKG